MTPTLTAEKQNEAKITVTAKADALTGARFFAALLVVFFHRGVIALSAVSVLLSAAAEIGFVAVGFFYSLSGFVLGIAYANRNYERATFYVHRFARVYPLYLLALLLSLPGFLLKWNHGEIQKLPGLGALFLAPSLLQAWIPQTALAWNGPGWSLSCEAFFYLIFPFVLPVIIRAKRKYLVWAVMALWAASIIPEYALHWLGGSSNQAQEQSTFWGAFASFSPIMRLPEFVAGIVLSQLVPSVAKKSRPVIGSLLIVAALGCVVAAIAYRSMLPDVVLHNGLLLPAWLMLITGLYWEVWLARFLAFAPIVFLGEISYSIYILQSPVSGYLSVILRPILKQSFVAQYPSMGTLAIYVMTLIVVSGLSYLLFERPVRNFINNWFKTRRSSALH